MKKAVIEVTSLLLCVLLLFAATWRMGFVLIPERISYGGTWNMFLEEPENSVDLMFVGSSHVYCNVIPARIYSETGVSTYVLSAPCLTMPLAYSYIREALKTQSPQVILLEATSMYFSRYMGYAKASIGYMPPSLNRVAATFTSAEPEERVGLFFPLYNYHGRWEEFAFSDYFTRRSDQRPDPYAGYTVLTRSEPQAERSERVFEYTESDMALQQKYLQKIIGLCEDRGIELEIMIAPACLYVSEADKQYLYEAAEGVRVTDFNDDFAGMGLDLTTDFFDSRHLNLYGAEKFSAALSDHIAGTYSLEASDVDRELWQQRASQLDELHKSAASQGGTENGNQVFAGTSY